MAAMASVGLGQSWELFLGLPCGCTGSTDLGYLLLISQAIGPEPDGRWKSWESNQHAYRMLGLQAVGLQTIPQYWPFGLFVHSAVRAGSAKRARELINSPHAQSCRATCAAVSECHKILFNVTVAGHICFWVSAFCSEAAGLPPSVIQCWLFFGQGFLWLIVSQNSVVQEWPAEWIAVMIIWTIYLKERTVILTWANLQDVMGTYTIMWMIHPREFCSPWLTTTWLRLLPLSNIAAPSSLQGRISRR